MKVIISYDIVENIVRSRVISLLESYGFIRVQKSVFLGEIKFYKLNRVVLEIMGVMDKEVDSIYFFPICEEDYKRTMFITKSKNHKIFYEKILFF